MKKYKLISDNEDKVVKVTYTKEVEETHSLNSIQQRILQIDTDISNFKAEKAELEKFKKELEDNIKMNGK